MEKEIETSIVNNYLFSIFLKQFYFDLQIQMEKYTQHLRNCHLVSEKERKTLHIPEHDLYLRA